MLFMLVHVELDTAQGIGIQFRTKNPPILKFIARKQPPLFKNVQNLFRAIYRSKANPPQIAAAGADIPIRSADEDLLGRTVLATRIAEMLSTPGSREGRVFAIRGGWGFGKSSLKNLIIEALKERKPKPEFLEFNPWQWGDGDQISRALFAQMASRLGGAHSPDATKRAKALRRYGNILAGSSASLNKAADDKGISTWLTSAALVCAAVGIGLPELPVKLLAAGALGLAGLALLIGKALSWLGQDQSSTSLDEIRVDLETRLGSLQSPLVVFVDDIDRLESDQIRILFRQIKVNANLPNIIFVLLFQPSIVEDALRPVAGNEGRQYLEKIVQIHFDLPPVSHEKLLEIFGSQLSNQVTQLAIVENGFDQTRWGNVLLGGVVPFIRNLRDVKRLLASIETHLPLHTGARAFEVNIIDFIALEAIRVFEPDLHAAIGANKPLLIQSGRFSGDNRDKSDREEIEKLLENSRETSKVACSNLLKELFPPAGWVFGGSHYSDGGWISSWMREKRVCTARGFDRYFALQIQDDVISESDFGWLIEVSNNRTELKAAIDTFRERKLLWALATRFDESVEDLPIRNIAILLPVMFQMGEEFSRQPVAMDPFNTPFVASWRASSWFLRRLDTPEERSAVALDAMVDAKALAVPSILISLDLDARKKDEGRDRLFDDVNLELLKSRWVQIFKARAEDIANILDDDHLISHLYRWRDFAGSFDEAKAWVEGIAKEPTLLPKLLVRFLSVGTSQGWGDKVAKKTEYYRRETLEDFFDLDSLKQRLTSIDPRSLSDEEKRILRILSWHLEKWEAGESTGF